MKWGQMVTSQDYSYTFWFCSWIRKMVTAPKKELLMDLKKLVALKLACIGKLFWIFWGVECYPMIDVAGAIASSPIATANWPVGALTRWGGLGIFNRGKSRTEWAMVSIHVLVYERVKDKYINKQTYPKKHPFWEESCLTVTAPYLAGSIYPIYAPCMEYLPTFTP
jgi:hypothetical protein